MIPLSTNIKQKYKLIYFKLIELKGLLKEKLEECHVDWEACINDSNNDITAELLAENKASFTQLIKCLVHIDSYAPHKEITDYNGYQIHNNSITYLDETNSDYYQNKTIHTKDYILIDKIYYYMSFLRWFLKEMGVLQYKINQAKTLKELILLLDEIIIYENVSVTFLTDDNDKIITYIDKKNRLDYNFISLKTKQKIDIPLSQLECTCENNNVDIQVTDAQKMNWSVNDQSYQIQDGQEYWIYDFYLEAEHPIPDQQFYNIQCSASFLNVNFVRDATDQKKIHVYSTPNNYPRLNQNDLFIVQLPKKIIQGKTYDAVRVTYQWGEYTLTYPNGESDTGIFITPQITTQLPQEVTCTFTFNGYEQYKPLTTNFTITVQENPFVMTSTIVNKNSSSIYFESENEGYNTDEWQIDVCLQNYKEEPIISKEIYLQIEDEEPFTAPLITDMNGSAQYIGTIPYFNSDFIDYTQYNMPDAIKFFINNGNINYNESKKVYHQYVKDDEYYQNENLETNDNDILFEKENTILEPLTSNEIEERIVELKQDNGTITTQLFYYYVFDENHKYKINFNTEQETVLGEEYNIEYPEKKEEINLNIYTTNDPVHDVEDTKKIKLYHKPIRIDMPENICVGQEIVITIMFYDILSNKPLEEHIYDNETVKVEIEGNIITETVSNSKVYITYTITTKDENEMQITIHNGEDNEEIFIEPYQVSIKKGVILDGSYISYIQD